MNIELYRQCERAFLREISITTGVVLDKRLTLSAETRRAILDDLVFAIACHISNSAHSGEVDGKLVYPALSYDLGDIDGVRVDGVSALHEIAGEVVASISAPDAPPEAAG